MAVITSSSFAKALYPGVNKWYGDAYNEYPVEYTDLVDVESSNRRYEEDVGYSGYGLAQIKAEGDGVAYDEEQQGFTTRYTHAVYALGFIVTRELMEDDLYDVVAKKKATGLAFSMRQTKEVVVANLYNNAFNSSYKGADNVEMCSDAHVNKAGGTWANELATSADLSEASLEQACIDIMAFTNDRGLKIAVMPKSLLVAPDNIFEAERILQTPHRVGTANNDLNVLYSMGKFPGGIKVNHYFTDSDAWFIRTSVKDGPKLFQRRKSEFTIDNDFDTENAKYKATERYSVGFTDPRGVYGSPGA